MRGLAALALVAWLTSACASTSWFAEPGALSGSRSPAGPGRSGSTAQPAGTAASWRLVAMHQEPVERDAGARTTVLELDDAAGRFLATCGCDEVHGSFRRDGDALTLTPEHRRITLLGCAPSVLQREAQLAQMLSAEYAWRMEDGALAVRDDRNTVAALFENQVAAPSLVADPFDPPARAARASGPPALLAGVAAEAAPSSPPKPAAVVRRRVNPGENLWSIAQAVYGAGACYRHIAAANAQTIDNGDVIFPGQELVIPAGQGACRAAA